MASIGSKIDALHDLREEKRKYEQKISEITETMNLAEADLLKQMQKENVDKATGKKATVSVSESIKPNVEDWDRFYAYIFKNKYTHLLERRPSVTGCRELFESKRVIPGVVPVTITKLNMRSTN